VMEPLMINRLIGVMEPLIIIINRLIGVIGLIGNYVVLDGRRLKMPYKDL